MAESVPGGNDANISVGVDSRDAERGLSRLEQRMYSFFRSADKAFNQNSSGMDKFLSRVNRLNDSFSRMIRTLGGFIAIRAMMQMVQGFIGRMIEVDRVFRGFIASMSVIKGSVAGATREYEFLLAMSNKLGVSVESAISQYHRLAASLKNVDTTGELTRHVFSGLSQAAVVLHARGRDVTLIFEAVQQMASKGKLSLEELQRQLGNTLPGAVATMAKSMMQSQSFIEKGITTTAQAERELRDQIEKGTINVYEAILRFSNQLKKDYGEGVKYASDQFTANFNRMKNSVFEFYRAVGSSDAMAGLTEFVRQITALFNDNNGQGAAGLGQGLGKIFRDMAQWVSELDSNSVQEFFETISTSVSVTGIIVSDFFDVFKGFEGPEVETPLLNFVEFIASTMAAVVDIFRTALAGVHNAVQSFKDVLFSMRDAGMSFGDFAMGTSDKIYSLLPGLQSNSEKQRSADYWAMRQGQHSQRNANSAAMKDSWNMFVNGPGEDNTTLAKVGQAFDSARTKIVARRYGVTGYQPYQLPGTGGTSGGVPAWMTPGSNKAGSSADAASNYFNPLGDSELQRLIEQIQANSGAPNASKKPKGRGKTLADKAEDLFLREQTRLLKELSVAQNEYQNVLSNKNRKEGENEAQMRSLLETDERYMALSSAKKSQLMEWAVQLDEANLKIQNAIKAQEAWNDAMVAGYDAEARISELRSTNFENQYREEQKMRDSFRQGGENEMVAALEKQRMLNAAIKMDSDQRNLDMERYASSIRLANDEMRFQAELMGMSRIDQEKMRQFREIDLNTQRLMVGATIQQQQEYLRLAEILKSDVSAAIDEVYAKQQSAVVGIQEAIQQYIEQFGSAAKNWGQVTANALTGMEDALVSFVETGKLSFKDLFRSIASDLARLIIRYMLVFMLQKLTGLGGGGGSFNLGSFQGSMGGFGSEIGGFTGGGTSIFSGGAGNFGGGSAKGNVFQAGRMKYFGQGGIFDRPVAFPMAGGRYGTAFESGPEAIVPLARDQSGNLGIRNVGSDGSGDAVLNLKVEVHQGEGKGVRSEMSREGNTDVLRVLIGEVAKSVRSGDVGKAIEATYALRKPPKRLI